MNPVQIETDSPRLQLTEPFDSDQVKWRPGSPTYAHKPECRGRDCRETHDAAKHMQFAYVEDELVMDRLDAVLGLGTWQWHVERVADGVVRGRLSIVSPTTGDWVDFEDFGYGGSGNSGESLKEASTDAFRRCGRMVGIARYIYAGELEQAHRPTAPRPAAPERAGGSPRPPAAPPSDDDEWAGIMAAASSADDPDGSCPVHGTAWQHYPAGTSKKTGKPYEAGWSCETFGCRERPGDGWKARHAA